MLKLKIEFIKIKIKDDNYSPWGKNEQTNISHRVASRERQPLSWRLEYLETYGVRVSLLY